MGEIRNRAADLPVTELWEVLVGALPGRTSTEQVTVLDSVGLALEDHGELRCCGTR